MDGDSRVDKPPLDMRREFVGSRLETQVLIRAYELAAPVIRGPVAAAPAARTRGVPDREDPRQRPARGACA
jgi:hypothetical protein